MRFDTCTIGNFEGNKKIEEIINHDLILEFREFCTEELFTNLSLSFEHFTLGASSCSIL